MDVLFVHTVDGAEILHQLRLVVYPIIYRVLYIPGGDRRISEPSTVVLVFLFAVHVCLVSGGGPTFETPKYRDVM